MNNGFIKSRTNLLINNVRFLTASALIGALYATLGIAFGFISFQGNQFRVAEVMTVLPAFTPAAIPGLYVGCMVTNLMSPYGLLDIFIGELVTLSAAILSRKLPAWLVGGLTLLKLKDLKKSLIFTFEGKSEFISTMIRIIFSRKLIDYIFVPLPPVVLNAVYVGLLVSIIDKAPLLPVVISVAIGQTIACYGIGIPFMIAFDRIKKLIKI